MPTRAAADALIYHITHVDNLSNILASDRLLCDAHVRKLNAARIGIGYEHIKARRLR